MEYDREGFVEAADGTRLFYEVLGEGDPPVVLTDGIGCDGFAWRYLAPRLGKHHRVIHWHFRGHGRSGPPRDPDRLSIEDLAGLAERIGSVPTMHRQRDIRALARAATLR